MASIELKSVFKAYGRLPPVLRGVDLQVATGEFCVFIGPSGCGKSTLLRMVAGLEDITEGELRLDGRRMNEVPPADRGIAMVFQSYALFPHLSVYDNIAFGLQLARRPKDEIDRRVREAARVLQLDALLERKPKALSGGQRQRVAIGRAIVRQPKVFLFDEPLSNLDTALRAQTRIEIARLHRSFEASSTIYVTHDQVEAMTLADRIVLLHAGPDVARHGSVAQCGTPMELFHTPRNRFVAGFLGSPPMNFLPAEVLGGDAGHAQVRLRGGPVLRCAVDGSRLAPGASVSVGVRPEHLLPGDGSGPCLQGEVTLVERLGTSTIVYLDAAGAHDLVAVLPGGAAVRSGDRLALAAPPQVLHVFDEAGDALPRRVDALEGLGPQERP